MFFLKGSRTLFALSTHQFLPALCTFSPLLAVQPPFLSCLQEPFHLSNSNSVFNTFTHKRKTIHLSKTATRGAFTTAAGERTWISTHAGARTGPTATAYPPRLFHDVSALCGVCLVQLIVQIQCVPSKNHETSHDRPPFLIFYCHAFGERRTSLPRCVEPHPYLPTTRSQPRQNRLSVSTGCLTQIPCVMSRTATTPARRQPVAAAAMRCQ